MSGDTSEEKSLPPSEKKLREARKKGNISKSQDVIAAVTMILLVLYLVFAWPSIFDSFAAMFESAGLAALRNDRAAWGAATKDTWNEMAEILLPLYIIAIAAIFLGSIISNKGFVFAIEPIQPNLQKINPVEGFKKIFSMRNLIEFIKAFVKSMLLLAGLGFSAWFGIEAIMQVPMCAEDCTAGVLVLVAAPLVFTALALFLFSAIIDVTVQKWLFTRDMRMTHSEFKREMKEMYGDPMIRRARNDSRRDQDGAEKGKATRYLKVRSPTIVIASGTQIAVAIRYVAGETPAPIIVARATGHIATALIEQAHQSGVPVANDPGFAEELFRQAKIYSFIPETFFREIARCMSQHMK